MTTVRNELNGTQGEIVRVTKTSCDQKEYLVLVGDRYEYWAERFCTVCTSTCYHCGELCTGDVTETIEIETMRGEMPVCDDAEECSRRCEKMSNGGPRKANKMV